MRSRCVRASSASSMYVVAPVRNKNGISDEFSGLCSLVSVAAVVKEPRLRVPLPRQNKAAPLLNAMIAGSSSSRGNV